MSFTVIPALDLHGGRLVRLQQGDFARETVFAEEPLALARRYAATGAAWLHVVDLDGARRGRVGVMEIIAELKKQTGLNLQVGGGVRSEDDVERLLAAGAARVVVGSVAARDPVRACAWMSSFGRERLTIALDVRWRAGGWRVASAGWTREEERGLDELAGIFAAAGLRHLLCTDIERDGTLSGPNFGLYARLRRLAPDLDIQISGGVCALDDLRIARACGAAGVVVGRALLEGRFTLAEALAC